MKILFSSLFFLIIISFNSCLTYHTEEITINFDDDFDKGTITVLYTDIRSSETEEEKQKADFGDLIKMYKNDIFLIDQIKEGCYVKERKLYEKDGVLIGSYSGIFQNIRLGDNEIDTRNEERYILMDIGPHMEIETNGKVYRSEYNALLVWPIDQKTLKIKKIVKDYDNVGFPILDFYKKWKEE